MSSNKFLNIVIYTKDDCPYCEATRKLLDFKELDYEEINISSKNYNTFGDKLLFKDEHLPKIYINDELIGGYQQIVDLITHGELG